MPAARQTRPAKPRRLVVATRSLLRRFRRDRRGAMLVQIGLLLPVLFGAALISLDLSRLYNLNTSLQSGADALALAAAAELDRRPDALIRAERAVSTLVANRQVFGEGADTLDRSAITVRYLKSLPASDADPIDASAETTDPAEAHYVEVTVKPVSFKPLVPASVVGVAETTNTAANAVAGFDQGVCEFAPIFICNPYEGLSTSLFQAAKDPAWRRRQIGLRQVGGTSGQYGPGNYGFLQPVSKPGTSELREMLAVDSPPACFIQSGVELRPGFIATANDAINVRFDIYEGNLKGKKSDESYRPARNVRKGYLGSGCNAELSEDDTAARGLTRDSCFEDGTCPPVANNMSGRIGDGNWDFDGYWSVNFGAIAKPTNSFGAPYSNSNPPSRYEVYRYEIDNNLVTVESTGTGGQTESGAPACYSGSTAALSDDPDRRLLAGAILDCTALDEKYGLNGASPPPLPVTAFARFFLTEPVGDDADSTIWVELVDVLEPGVPGANTMLHDIVQLYR